MQCNISVVLYLFRISLYSFSQQINLYNTGGFCYNCDWTNVILDNLHNVLNFNLSLKNRSSRKKDKLPSPMAYGAIYTGHINYCK